MTDQSKRAVFIPFLAALVFFLSHEAGCYEIPVGEDWLYFSGSESLSFRNAQMKRKELGGDEFIKYKYREIKNVLDLNFSYSFLTAGLTFQTNWYVPRMNEVWEKGLIADEQMMKGERRFSLEKKYVRASFDDGDLLAGDFYANFGRGIILNVVKDEAIDRDDTIEGVRFDIRTDRFNAVVLGGRIELPVSRDLLYYGLRSFERKDVVGCMADCTLFDGFVVGSGFLHYDRENARRSSAFTAEWTGIFDLIDLYGEVGHLRYGGEDGQAIYASMNLFLEDWDFLAEFIKYQDVEEFPLNNPPTADREDEFLSDEEKRDICGGRFKANYAVPGQGTILYVDSGYFKTPYIEEFYSQVYKDTPKALYHIYGGVEQHGLFDRIDATAWAGFRDGFERKFRTESEISWRFTGEQSVSAGYKREEREKTPDPEIHEDRENDYSVGYAYSPWFSGTLTWQRQNPTERDRANGDRDNLYSVDLLFTPMSDFDFSIMFGGLRGGRVCSNGICAVRPAFRGIEIKANYRF